MRKYYFVYGYTESRVWMPDRVCDYTKNDFQDIIDVHPIQYQIDCNEKYEKPFEYYGGTKSERYVVTNWQELSEEEYTKFNGWI